MRVVAPLDGLVAGGVERREPVRKHVGFDAREYRVVGTGRLGNVARDAAFQTVADRRGDVEAVPVDDVRRLLIRRGVRYERSAGHDVEVVPDDVAEDESDDRRGRRGLGESTALERGEMLSDGVYLVYRGTAGEQFVGDLPDVPEREIRRRHRQQCASAAGDDAEDERLFGRRLGEGPDAFGTLHATLTRDGVIALDEFDPGRLRKYVGNDGSPVDAVAQFVLETGGYRPRRVPTPDDENLVVLREVVGRVIDGQPFAVESDVLVDDSGRMGTLDAGLETV